jgi:hypothetical protein
VFTIRCQRQTRIIRTVGRAVAFTLVVLGVLPFTAPFHTCDLGTLASRAVHRDVSEHGRSRGPSIADAVFVLASVGDAKETLKNLASTPAALPPVGVQVTVAAGPAPADCNPAPAGLVPSSVLRI